MPQNSLPLARLVPLVLLALAACATPPAPAEKIPAPLYAFTLSAEKTLSAAEHTHGFEAGFAPDGDKPFLFSVQLPEGNYRVTVTFGDAVSASATTVKAELRRLMLENVTTAPGQFVTRDFLVNVRTPAISTGGEVKLKDRERGMEWVAWDDRLTLEFNGPHPRVRSLEIRRADTAPTIFLLGDSTVCDQPREKFSSWGQMLPRFFAPTVVVANHAESGESLRSSLGARRLDKVLGAMRRGDWLLIQYGHNDMKEHGDGVGAFTTYAADLKKFAAAARAQGASVVLLTPMHRRTFDDTGKIKNSLGDYPEAVRRVASEENLPLIDLHALSAQLYETLGAEKSKLLFNHPDATHHNNYGAYELARCVVEALRTADPALAKHLAPDVAPFDPTHPDDPKNFYLPASPQTTTTKPLGN